MKTTLILIATSLSALFSAVAADTNVLYLPAEEIYDVALGEEAKLHLLQESARRDHELAQRLHGLTEYGPAELDPAGHWGPVTAGLQLSARVPTNVFAAGTPINLSLTVRNTTTNSIIIPSRGVHMFELVVLNQYGRTLTPTNVRPSLQSWPADTLLPGRRQVKCEFELGSAYDLATPGSYTVRAKRRGDKVRASPDLLSGPVSIQVVPGRGLGPAR